MESFDPYDPLIAFDDFYGEVPPHRDDELERIVWELIAVIFELHKKMHRIDPSTSLRTDLVGEAPTANKYLHGIDVQISCQRRN